MKPQTTHLPLMGKEGWQAAYMLSFGEEGQGTERVRGSFYERAFTESG